MKCKHYILTVIKHLIAICLLCFIDTNAIAQNPFIANEFKISTLTQDNGLSQGSNYFRFEDSKGFMWITCNDAINRYDGCKVKVYNLEKYFINCPNLQQGYGFAEDANANVYIGSPQGLYKYIREKDKFELIKVYSKTDETCMPFAFSQNKVWCFNKAYQIKSYNILTKKVVDEFQIALPAIPSIHIYDLVENSFYYRFPFMDDDSNAWFLSANKIICFNTLSKQLTYPLANYFATNHTTIYSCYFDRKNKNLAIACSKEMILYNLQNKTFKHTNKVGNNVLYKGYCVAINNNFIVLKNQVRLLFFDTSFVENFSINKYIGYDYATFQYSFDKANRLWICVDGHGQAIFNFKNYLLNKIGNDNFRNYLFGTIGITSFGEFSNGDIFTNSTLAFTPKTKQLTKLIDLNILSSGYRIATDLKRKRVWYYTEGATNSNWIKYLDEQKKSVACLAINDAKKLGLQQDMMVLDNGEILCSFSSGLYWFNPNSYTLTLCSNQLANNSFKINKLANNYVAISYLNNDMWLAKCDAGNQIKFIKKILPGVQSFYVAEDTAKKMNWVGCNSGVYLLDKNFEIVKKINANDGIAGTYIYGILLDNEGNVWCSHQHGISSINSTDFKIINYTKEDGLQDWDFNNRAFYKAQDGTLFFGGVSGFNYFKPPLKNNTFYQPQVYIDEILVNNKTVAIDTNANSINALSLKANENNIAIAAIVKDLENGNDQKIAYRLNNQAWTLINNNTPIQFSNLASGKYTLELGCYNKLSAAIENQKTISINIAQPFYKAAWFLVLVPLLVMSFIFIVYFRRKIRNEKIIFEKKLAIEQDRNRITTDLHDDIGSTLSSIQLNSSIAQKLIDVDASKAKILLGKMTNQTKDVIETMSDIIWSLRAEKEQFVNIESKIKIYVSDLLSGSNIHYNIDIDTTLNTAITNIKAKRNCLLIIKEAVNNIAKYSNASQVNIDLHLKETALYIKIIDNGNGFDAATIKQGNGLKNMQKRTKELNGVFNISTTENKGVIIEIAIPQSNLI